jgi:hypothetical protein
LWKVRSLGISWKTCTMKRTFIISIPKPCHEKWEEFSPTSLGGYCASCQKEVIDFTTWDEDRIKAYFTNRSQTSCGRFYPSQLKNYTLEEAPQFNFLRWTYVPLISLVMLLFSRNAQAQKVGKTRIERTAKTGEAIPVVGDNVHVKVIKGVVKSFEDQSTLPGVNVVLKGTTTGTVTDAEGKFLVTIRNPKPTDSLVFSFIGLETESYSVQATNDLAVFMKLDVTELNEEIIVGGVCARRFSLRNLGWRIGNLFRRR